MLLILHKEAIIPIDFCTVNAQLHAVFSLTRGARADMFDGQDVDFDDTAGCKQMGRYRRLMHMSACIVAAFGIAAPAFASGVATRPGQALDVEVARAAIVQAERAVRRAEARRVLWTTANEALRGARRAFEKGDLTAAVGQARIAQEQAELAIAQKRYPPFRV